MLQLARLAVQCKTGKVSFNYPLPSLSGIADYESIISRLLDLLCIVVVDRYYLNSI